MMRELDPVRLGDQAEQGTVAVKRPAPAALLDAKAGLVVAEQRDLRHLAVRGAIDQIDRLIADPVDGHDLHRLTRHDSPHPGAGAEVFERGHRWLR